jgi:hypothetical protein
MDPRAPIAAAMLWLSATGVQAMDLEEATRSARAAAARHSGAAADAIELVKAETVTWPDGSLGCPRPDMGYTQALVPGYRIRLRAHGALLDYHAGRSGRLVLCPARRSVDPLPGAQ